MKQGVRENIWDQKRLLNLLFTRRAIAPVPKHGDKLKPANGLAASAKTGDLLSGKAETLRPTTSNLLAMTSAAAVFAPRRLPFAKIDDIGVLEHVADAHVDPFARGGRAQSAHKLRDE